MQPSQVKSRSCFIAALPAAEGARALTPPSWEGEGEMGTAGRYFPALGKLGAARMLWGKALVGDASGAAGGQDAGCIPTHPRGESGMLEKAR